MSGGLTLAIETSCDDTCAAVIDGAGRIHANVISSQGVHDAFGGVVPEIASRQHLALVSGVIAEALRQADATLDEVELIGATQGPGLVGALLVGFCAGKALAAARELPFTPVNHIAGHVAANFLAENDAGPLQPPFLCLVASGGHTLLAHVHGHDRFAVLGTCLDDAAGEAFDKGARMLGLGFPGGPALERLARDGDPGAFAFPGAHERARGRRGGRGSAFAESLDFSFAGLKTALLYKVRELGPERTREAAADLAASYQRAIVASLRERTERALERTGLKRLAIGGGVAANGALRESLGELDVELRVPGMSLCTDNAAMIASAARYTQPIAYPHYLPLEVFATGERPLGALATEDRPPGASATGAKPLGPSATGEGPP